MSVVNERNVLSGFFAVAFFNGVLEELEPVTEDLCLHPAIRAKRPVAEKEADFKLASPVVPDRDEVHRVFLVATRCSREDLRAQDGHLVEDLHRRRVVGEATHNTEQHETGQGTAA